MNDVVSKDQRIEEFFGLLGKLEAYLEEIEYKGFLEWEGNETQWTIVSEDGDIAVSPETTSVINEMLDVAVEVGVSEGSVMAFDSDGVKELKTKDKELDNPYRVQFFVGERDSFGPVTLCLGTRLGDWVIV